MHDEGSSKGHSWSRWRQVVYVPPGAQGVSQAKSWDLFVSLAAGRMAATAQQ